MALSRRRWFQFKLSTWFVLTVITAWAMTQWPWIVDSVDYRVVGTDARGKLIWKSEDITILNPALLWPGIVFVAFLIWKTAWPMMQRQYSERENLRHE